MARIAIRPNAGVITLVVFAALAACRKSSATDGQAEASNAVGVVECDEFLADYERCVSGHVPDDRKKAVGEQIARNRAAWRAMAADPGARPGLPQACRLARENAHVSTRAFGCSW